MLTFGWLGKYKKKTFSTSHLKFWNEQAAQISGFFDENDKMNSIIWEKNFESDLESYTRTGGLIHSEYNFYTDGSKIADRVGAGFVGMRGSTVICRQHFRLPENISVF